MTCNLQRQKKALLGSRAAEREKKSVFPHILSSTGVPGALTSSPRSLFLSAFSGAVLDRYLSVCTLAAAEAPRSVWSLAAAACSARRGGAVAPRGASLSALACADSSALAHWTQNSACGVSPRSRSARAASTSGAALEGSPQAAARTSPGPTASRHRFTRSRSRSLRLSRSARSGALAASAASTAAGVTSGPRSPGSNVAPGSSENSRTPSAGAATARCLPVALRASAVARTGGERRAAPTTPVPSYTISSARFACFALTLGIQPPMIAA